MLLQPLADMATHEFVSLTTFRRSGEPVSVPVWIAADGDALVVTTPASSGKVKRLRRDPRVELRPCSRRGKIYENAPVVSATATVAAPDAAAEHALRAKYGWQYRLILAVENLLRRNRHERVILRVTSA